MKRSILAIVLALATLIAGSAVASARDSGSAPKGAHDYQLNIIGVDKAKNADMDGNNGHRIFVPLSGKTNIYLSQGDYGVIDANGTDGSAEFSLPAPGYDSYIIDDCDPDGVGACNVVSNYSIFIRSLGKPGGWANIRTCADLIDSSFTNLLGGKTVKSITNALESGTNTYCSLDQVGQEITMRSKGKSSWTNVTGELTSIRFEVTYDNDGEDRTVSIRVPIFDDLLENEYWEYDNNGLRLLQVRFYDCSTNVDTNESDCEF
jgi:hypothetical protein